MHNNQSLSSNLTKVIQVFTKSQHVTFSFNISYAYKLIEKIFSNLILMQLPHYSTSYKI